MKKRNIIGWPVVYKLFNIWDKSWLTSLYYYDHDKILGAKAERLFDFNRLSRRVMLDASEGLYTGHPADLCWEKLEYLRIK